MQIKFPTFTGIRCLMMPYVQGEPDSVPESCASYRPIIASTFISRGDIGFLTIDESVAIEGRPHRGKRARHARALHTEAGLLHGVAHWGDVPTWGGKLNVTLDHDVRILIASNVDDTCAVWDAEHKNTSADGDIGHCADAYPYRDAQFLGAGDVREIGIFTPHESLPVKRDVRRQFLRIVGAGVRGREDYFTTNPLVSAAWGASCP